MTENTPETSPSQSNTDYDNSKGIEMDPNESNEKVTDFDTMILETQKRVWGALKKGYEYSGSIDESDKFLRKHVFSKLNMMVIYVDLVGSTTMTLEMRAEKIATIIGSFAQEMAAVIRQNNGYVLKFVGDSVIGYFVDDDHPTTISENALNCAKSMVSVIHKGINPILNQYDYPDLMVKVGIDFGQNMVVRYGADVQQSHVDLIGPAMNIAAKIQSMAKPDQILIGSDVYDNLSTDSQKEFIMVRWKKDEWKYRSRLTGDIYQVYEFKG